MVRTLAFRMWNLGFNSNLPRVLVDSFLCFGIGVLQLIACIVDSLSGHENQGADFLITGLKCLKKHAIGRPNLDNEYEVKGTVLGLSLGCA